MLHIVVAIVGTVLTVAVLLLCVRSSLVSQ